jgi:hypothetical protein
MRLFDPDLLLQPTEPQRKRRDGDIWQLVWCL